MTTVLQATDIHKIYEREGAPEVHALRGVNLRVEAGEFLAITGPSGCGKSTLLTVISGLELPTQGTVALLGHRLDQASPTKLADLRNTDVGFVFQSFHLIGSMTALENVAFPAELAGAADATKRAEELLERVGLQHRRDSLPHQLSGGEKQRVAICRALVNRARLIFADEPTGNLDSENGQEVLSLLTELQKETDSSLVLVSHSQDIVAQADRQVQLKDGRVIESP